MALHLLGVAQLHVAVSDRGVDAEVGGGHDGGDELVAHFQEALVGLLVAHDAVGAHHDVHVAGHLRDLGEAVEVRDLAYVADAFPEEGGCLFPEGKVQFILQSCSDKK